MQHEHPRLEDPRTDAERRADLVREWIEHGGPLSHRDRRREFLTALPEQRRALPGHEWQRFEEALGKAAADSPLAKEAELGTVTLRREVLLDLLEHAFSSETAAQTEASLREEALPPKRDRQRRTNPRLTAGVRPWFRLRRGQRVRPAFAGAEHALMEVLVLRFDLPQNVAAEVAEQLSRWFTFNRWGVEQRETAPPTDRPSALVRMWRRYLRASRDRR